MYFLYLSWLQLSKSNQTQVTISNVDFNLAGHYSCEVTVDNTFSTITAEELLKVVCEYITLSHFYQSYQLVLFYNNFFFCFYNHK